MPDEMKTIKAIRTNEGDLPVDYRSLANKPSSDTTLTESGGFADSKTVGDQIKNINSKIREIQGGDALAGITINGKKLSDNPVLTATDVGAAEIKHNHDAAELTSGLIPMDRISVLPPEKGGHGADNGKDGLKNLLASGPMILASGKQYGTPAQFQALKEANTAEAGQVFFVKIAT